MRRLAEEGCTVEVLAAGDGPAGVTRAREGAVTVTRIAAGCRAAALSSMATGAPEALERRGARAWLGRRAFHGRALPRGPRRRRAMGRDREPLAGPLRAGGDGGGARAAPARRRALGRRRAARAHSVRARARALACSWAPSSRSSARICGADSARSPVAAWAASSSSAPDARLFHPVSADERQVARERLGFVRPTVLSVGRLVPDQGLQSADRRRRRRRSWRRQIDLIAILGAGPEEAALRARARRRGVGLRLPGLVARDRVPAWLAAADLYVQPSRVLPSGRTEGLPMATLEALAVGLPVIASRSGGLAELAAEGRRVSFCAPNDIASLRVSLGASGIGRGLRGGLTRAGLDLSTERIRGKPGVGRQVSPPAGDDVTRHPCKADVTPA